MTKENCLRRQGRMRFDEARRRGGRLKNVTRPHAPGQGALTVTVRRTLRGQNPVRKGLPNARGSRPGEVQDAWWREGLRRAQGNTQRQLQARPQREIRWRLSR